MDIVYGYIKGVVLVLKELKKKFLILDVVVGNIVIVEVV